MKEKDASIPRRDFLRLSTAAVGGLVANGLPALNVVNRLTRFVPMDKGTVGALLAMGERAVFRGAELKFVGMPIGGICAGQVYLGGDGRLWLWDIFNQIKFGTVPKRVNYRGGAFEAGGGANYIEPPEQVHPFEQGFAIQVNGKTRQFKAGDWKDIAFTGEYPMGFVEYKDPSCPVEVTLEAFSPFIPLNAEESALPAVTMRFRVKNTSNAPVKVNLGGWIENPIGLHTVRDGEALRNTQYASDASCLTLTMEEPHTKKPAGRPAIVFERWDQPTYAGWTVAGTAFGKGPTDKAKFFGSSGNVGGPGKQFAKSYYVGEGETNVQGDARTGRLTSRDFTIERRYIEFYIGGGRHPKTACLNLLINGKIVRTATGVQDDALRLETFDVAEFEGQKARIEIVDDEPGFWGQIGVGQIAFVDTPTNTLPERADFGDMAFALLDSQPGDWACLTLSDVDDLFSGQRKAEKGHVVSALTPTRPKAGLVRTMTIEPGKEATAVFAITWRFPNLVLNVLGKVDHHYAARFKSARAVVDYLSKNFKRLDETTRLWHETWYDSTLPRWFLDRCMGNTSTLATMTCVRFADGRFYGWEGVGCCDGTCGHVWQYAQTVGRLFPELERSVREMADYERSFQPDTGLIRFRGEYGFLFAIDAQAGYILRTYREHQVSADDRFLKRVYSRMKQALEYLIKQDENDDGIIEGRQHNTLDVDLYGPSSWLTSLYLAALRAGEEMANEMGDKAAATRWRGIFKKGSAKFDEIFWNGDYYIHVLDKAKNLDSMRIGDGCEADQLMGQGWAHQVGLGRIVNEERSRAALKALYKNNFLSDIGPFRDEQKAGRWYALPGEPGLLMCTFPKGDRNEVLGPKPTWASMYFNECWTGSEFEAAGHMVAEGLVEEGMRVARAVHDRHHPAKRNPWNEIECSDHYARCMSVYGMFVTLSGFEYHGPKGHIAFAPRLNPENFRSAFTAAEGWGTYRQRFTRSGLEAGIKVCHGSLRLNTIALQGEGNQAEVTIGTRKVEAKTKREGKKVVVTLARPTQIKEGEELTIRLRQA